MTETLLSISNILLFGRRVQDLAIAQPSAPTGTTARVSTRRDITTTGLQTIDGITVANNNTVLVRRQKPNNASQNDLYQAANGAWTAQNIAHGTMISVQEGEDFGNTTWITRVQNGNRDFFRYNRTEGRLGANGDLEGQLDAPAVCFARIYGFSYEGTYYDLPQPTLFMVHGDGDDPVGTLPAPAIHAARGPLSPSLTGIGAADYQLAEDIRVWSYDKADYTVRMDVQTGMFEQVLLDIFFGGGGPGVSGARVSGARVSGARVSGARVSGARLSGGSSD